MAAIVNRLPGILASTTARATRICAANAQNSKRSRYTAREQLPQISNPFLAIAWRAYLQSQWGDALMHTTYYSYEYVVHSM